MAQGLGLRVQRFLRNQLKTSLTICKTSGSSSFLVDGSTSVSGLPSSVFNHKAPSAQHGVFIEFHCF